MNHKKTVCLLLSMGLLLMTMVSFPFAASAKIIEGGPYDKPGPDAIYQFNTDTGQLSIIGTGNLNHKYILFSSFKDDITSIVVSEGITNISDWLFYGLTNVKSVKLPDTVREIGDVAFSGCTSLQSITLGSELRSIGFGAFENCVSLTSITLPEKVYWIDTAAFYKSGLTSITIPSSVTTYGTGIFEECPNLQTAVIHSNADIPGQMFKRCPSLKTVTLSERIKSIGNEAFWVCESLTDINIPSYVTNIGTRAFSSCDLRQLKLPYSLRTLGVAAFGSNENLESIEFGAGITAIPDSCFSSCSALKKIVLPVGVTSIGENAFSYCQSLENLALPPTVTTIGANACSHCPNLESIVIPASVSSIGNTALTGMNNETDGKELKFVADSLSGISLSTGLPEKQTLGWRPFAAFEEIWSNGETDNITLTLDETNLLENTQYLPGSHTASDFFPAKGNLFKGTTLQLPENGIYTFYSMDEAGNQLVKEYTVTKIDKLAPAILATPDGTLVRVEVTDR